MTDVFMIDGISADVPAILQRFPGFPVAGYITGGFPIEWRESQFDLFARKIRIDQQAGDDQAALDARVLDVETGAARPADVPRFAAIRRQAGHHDTTVYVDLSNVTKVLAAVGGNPANVDRWWLAWWWNRPGHPTAEQVQTELSDVYGATIPLELIWGCQYRSRAQWDRSVIYGAADFSRR